MNRGTLSNPLIDMKITGAKVEKTRMNGEIFRMGGQSLERQSLAYCPDRIAPVGGAVHCENRTGCALQKRFNAALLLCRWLLY